MLYYPSYNQYNYDFVLNHVFISQLSKINKDNFSFHGINHILTYQYLALSQLYE